MPLRTLVSLAAALLLVSAPACSHLPSGVIPEAEIRLDASAAAAQLDRSLPVALSFDDRMGTAQVALLPTAIDIENAEPIIGYRAGDVAYLASEQSIIVFLSDGIDVPSEGLVLLGHVTSGMEDLADCSRNCAVRLVGAGALHDDQPVGR